MSMNSNTSHSMEKLRKEQISGYMSKVPYKVSLISVFFSKAERGASARVFTIGGAFFKEQERQWRENADGHINNFDFSRLQKLPEDFNTKEKFKEYLKNFRQEVINFQFIASSR